MTASPRYSGAGAQFDPFVIEDDDDFNNAATRTRRIAEEARRGRQLADWAARQDRLRDGSAERTSLEEDEIIETILEEDISNIIDLTEDDNDAPSLPRVLREEGTELHVYTTREGLVLQAGITVELRKVLGAHGVQFLRVQSILKPARNPEVIIRGFGFARTRQLDGMLPRRLNEVAMVEELRIPDANQWKDHALVTVAETDVWRCRDLRVTNAPFPEHRFSQAEYARRGKMWVEDYAPLVCRFRYNICYHGHIQKPFEWALIQIGEEDADPAYGMEDRQNLSRWRGGKVPGGSFSSQGFSQPVIELEGASSCAHGLAPGQRYTAGDIFAGAGGASRGIERAGLKLMFAVDHWDHAAQSLRANFRAARIYNMDVTDFITSTDTKTDVDILHLSPPCQFWSPAHTVAGKNDENNIAVLFSCTHLIEKFRPRLFTVEQTFGILSPKFSEFFNTFIHGFTKLGYSVRWKVTPLANYGLPQLRKRLIMIGSAPGEKLPPFPPPTHSKDGAGGLKPWATPQSVLACLSSPHFTHPLHQPHLGACFESPKTPWDPTKLARTITTNGGQNYHWDGHRNFTLLEYAVLQGFPTWHKFKGRYIKKQIGNAFAPSVVKVLYEHLVRWLLVQDGFDPSACRGPRTSLPINLASGDYIRLDDGGGGDGNDEDEVRREMRREVQAPGIIMYGSISATVRPREEEEDELVYLGARKRQRLSEVVRALNRAAKEEHRDDVMEFTGVDDLSDTETLRESENSQSAVDGDLLWDRGWGMRSDLSDTETLQEGENGVRAVGITVGSIGGAGTANDPYVLSDPASSMTARGSG